MKIHLVFLLLVCFSKYSQQQEDGDRTIRLCGRDLAQGRVLLCYGSQLVKRGDVNALDSTATKTMSDDIDDAWPLLARRSALMKTRWGRHKRSGLVNECCLKSCTIEELQNYC